MSLLYPFTDPAAARERPPTVIVAGDGLEVTDDTGRRYLDAVSGLWCAGLGFSDRHLIDAAMKQLDTLPYYHSFLGRTAEPTLRLAERLSAIAPAPLSRVFFANSGSEAVDTAIKFVWYYRNARGETGRKRIIARGGAYHGSGVLSGALTAMSYCHDGFDPALPLVVRVSRPHHRAHAQPRESERAYADRLVDELDSRIRAEGAETIAAMIGEPVIGSGGAIPPPDGYWPAVREVLDAHGILLIADEIITGFGRTGRWFGASRYGMRPDLMTIAKQLTGAYVPMSAVLLSDAVAEVIEDAAVRRETLGQGFTYGGHPVAAAVALAAIERYEALDIEHRVSRLGAHLAKRLASLTDSPVVFDLRAVGLIAGVELLPAVDAGASLARRVAEGCEADGLLLRVIDDTLAISPPLIVETDELDRIVDILATHLERVDPRDAGVHP